MTSPRPISIFPVIAVLSAVACSSQPSSGQLPGRRELPIVGGELSDASQDAVVRINILKPGGPFMGELCTGTLIAPNLVLTARHCITDINGTSDHVNCIDRDGGADDVFSAAAVVRPDRITVQVGLHLSSVVGFQVTKLFIPSATAVCGNDITLLLLAKDVPKIKPRSIRLVTMPVIGETFTALGWGLDDTGTDTYDRLQRKKVAVLGVGPGNVEGRILTENLFMTSAAICAGDSGGPALADATEAVIGVAYASSNGTGVGDSCAGVDERNFYTGLVPHRALIEAAFAEAGHPIAYEGDPDPGTGAIGAPCTADTTCTPDLVCTPAAAPTSDAGSSKGTCGTRVAPADAGPDGGADGATPPTTSGATGSGKSGCSMSAPSGTSSGSLASLAGLASLVAIAARRRRRR